MFNWTRSARPSQRKTGFTLVELVIVIAILLVLSTLTLAMFGSSSDADRIRSSARQLQSSLLGARDRAIKSRVPRGLQLILQDATAVAGSAGTRVATSMVYVGSADYWRQGAIQVGRADFNVPSLGFTEMTANDEIAEHPEQVIVRGSQTDWNLLLSQGLIQTGSKIEIPAFSGDWYTINTELLLTPPAGAPVNVEYLVLQMTGCRQEPALKTYPVTYIHAQEPLLPNAAGVGGYRLALNPTLLPAQEPMRLSSGIVVDLDRSVIPSAWVDTSGAFRQYHPFGSSVSPINIMFTPRGWIADGSIVAAGVIHFYLCSQEDADLKRDPADPKSGEKLILSVFPQTGSVATFPVDITDLVNNSTLAASPDGLADDPFHYAKVGGTAGR